MTERNKKKILIIYTGGTIVMMKTVNGYTPEKEGSTGLSTIFRS